MSIKLKKYSYRFAEQIFNSKLDNKNEIKNIIYSSCADFSKLTRPGFNGILEKEFKKYGWESQVSIFPSV